MNDLSLEEANFLSVFEGDMERLLTSIKNAQKFQLGDYCILYNNYIHPSQRVLQRNTYGVALKFKVVKVSDNQIAFLRQLNSVGNPSGPLLCAFDLDRELMQRRAYNSESGKEYDLDPGYVDYLLLDTGTEYDPMAEHNSAKENRKSNLAHNNLIKLDLTSLKVAIEVLKTLKDEQELWVSPKRSFIIQSAHYIKRPIKLSASYKDGTRVRYRVVDKYILEFNIRWSNGKVETLLPHNFVNTNLYVEPPLSYKKSSDSI